MNWSKRGAYVLMSDPPGFRIARFGMGASFTYQAFRDKSSIHVERDIPKDDEAARRDAVRRCMAACEAGVA